MTDEVLQPDDGSLEVLPLGARRYSIEDGRIAVIAGTGEMNREAIDEWADALRDAILNEAAEGRPVYVLSDTSAHGQGFSNYARKRIMDVHATLPPDVDVYGAMLLPASVMAQFVSIFLQNLMRITSKRLHARAFTDRDAAIAWLNQMRAAHS